MAVQVENAGFGAVAAGPIGSLMVEQYLTGSISASPQRQWILQSVLAVRSESLLTEDDESGEADGESAESEPGDDA